MTRRAQRAEEREIYITNVAAYTRLYGESPRVGHIVTRSLVKDSAEGETFCIITDTNHPQRFQARVYLSRKQLIRKRKRARRENKGHAATQRAVTNDTMAATNAAYESK